MSGTQLTACFELEQEPFLVKVDMSTKLEDLGKVHPEHLPFDQGDTLLLVRAFELPTLI